MRFLFTCGGTAGHINPALAIAGKLRELFPEADFLFVGAGRDLEKKLIPESGFELRNITITGFARGVSPRDIKHNIATARNLAVSKRQCRDILDSFRPDIAVGTGGYVCYPVLNAASKRGIPTVIHESNAVPGLTTKLLSDRVDMVMAAFPSVAAHCKRPERVVLTGTPIRDDFLRYSREEAKRRLGVAGEPLVVSFWGSLGAEGMNDKMADFIRLNCQNHAFHHLHATGSGDRGMERMRQKLRSVGVESLPPFVDMRPYIDDMGEVMTAADLILCRAGASTLAEITALGRASILVPSPNVTNDQQTKNARELEKSGGAVVILEEGCTGEALYGKVTELLGTKSALSSLERASGSLGVKDACGAIADNILKLMGV